jgi:DNA replicative helicase MCM subunit Mcm2 (Cdc46/Mcm family)
VANKILTICISCKSEIEVARTSEIAPNVTKIVCNWCPQCAHEATADYHEVHHTEPAEKIEPDKNQQDLFTQGV